jgi:anti-sigma-K factor RskA
VALGVWIAVGTGGGSGPLRSSTLAGAAGSVVTTDDGRNGILVLSNLRPAPRGKTYEAWVIEGSRARPAGLFRAGPGTVTVRLSERVPRGARVGVTVEHAGGASSPTSAPLALSAPF